MAFLRKLLKTVSASVALILIASTSMAYASVNVGGLNGTTGPRSDNRSEFETNRVWDVIIENNKNIIRDFFTDITTGGNRINENTLVGDQLGGNIDVTITGRNDTFASDSGFFDMPAMSIGDVSASGGNSITGPNSLNENTIIANQRATINHINNSEISNNVNFRATTGFNEVSDNTCVGDVNTGGISVSADLGSGDSSLANNLSSFNSGNIQGNDASARFSNLTTGPNSENINRLEADSIISETVRNNISMKNQLDFNVNAGNNRVSDNTSVGNIRTGDVSINAMVD